MFLIKMRPIFHQLIRLLENGFYLDPLLCPILVDTITLADTVLEVIDLIT